ncbi:MAG: alpha-L-glutamate ligase [Candidatus Tectomicrobia bacterium RIFCSPLOWO2_02_FULL_70_19]|nr:MAG: alpha-L-glutamate ligase [Candidatus Tectomicrobia bacterium RIFCSPLOWO2_02_FULL_70_19]
MARIGVFIERYTVQKSEEMGALLRLGHAAERLGHRLDVLFRPDMYKIPECDALFIRALTDPLNAAYVAARLAQLHGLRVIDDPESILVCCDKVHMYRRVQAAGVPMPETLFLDAPDVNPEAAAGILEALGSPLVLKAPNSSFSRFVDKVETPGQFVRVGRRFLRRADRLVVQRFVASEYDWRVGVLAGQPLYVCRYMIPKRRWKVLTYTPSGRAVFGEVRGMELSQANPLLVDTALRAAAAIGNGLYGVDLKQVGEEFQVIEVNDNPTIAAGEEDQKAPGVYERLVRYLAGEWG